jgi:hypothetical protein
MDDAENNMDDVVKKIDQLIKIYRNYCVFYNFVSAVIILEKVMK